MALLRYISFAEQSSASHKPHAANCVDAHLGGYNAAICIEHIADQAFAEIQLEYFPCASILSR